MSTQDNKAELARLMLEYPGLVMRGPSPQQVSRIKMENAELSGFYANDASGWIGVMEDALRAGRQVVLIASGPESIGLLIAKPGTRLF